jgi:hypothetical protein
MRDLELLGELLTLLETRESQLMEWGFFDHGHTAAEIVSIFNSSIYSDLFSSLTLPGEEELFVDDLAASNLLFRLPDSSPVLYRSRFAESLRLFRTLKQRFKDDDWSYAPELVSDIKLHLAPRRFPVRDIDPSKSWELLSGESWDIEIQRQVLEALTINGEKHLNLAQFQIRSAVRLLKHYCSNETASGTVVTAGTGGGKTKSFYIPAFMGIAADIKKNKAYSTKVLSIYPRNVLLADQFGEATSQAILVNQRIQDQLGRKITIGALLGDVPFNSDFEGDKRNKWALSKWIKPSGIDGRIVPHISIDGKQLVWMDSDRRSQKSILRFLSHPSSIAVPDGVLCLTRDDLLKKPPDIFLTSIEMINKEMSSEIGRKLLGFGNGLSALRMVLLDEAHTYEGLTGAQVPWIIRRLIYWTKPIGQDNRKLHFVGLSATLQDAPNHLATLTGINENCIEEISPDSSLGETTIEGNEYNIVLKSHPGSGAGVLATSIQGVMLGSRVLTPRANSQKSVRKFDASFFYGTKLFGFTDNLDVVNRWYPDFVNAERFRQLAKYRISKSNDYLQWKDGQIWKLPENLGHNLLSKLTVARTSSQDPGVDSNADVVLATSSLEVGFDDDDIGMVFQHKAPRSAASFLQRKGRAGRRKGMRPWTVVVLSEHGRDRWAFKDSERLFSPTLDKLALPIFNPYVLKIQSTWFLIDWISNKVGDGIPNLYLTRGDYQNPKANELIKNLILEKTFRDDLTKDFASWLKSFQGGFHLTDPDSIAKDILWNPPRAIIRNVIPEIWKLIRNDFVNLSNGKARLLPKFLPERTWDVLDSQEVELEFSDKTELLTMDARKVLFEIAPGRVSRRHAINVMQASQWLSWSINLINNPPKSVSVNEIFNSYEVINDLDEICIYQPLRLSISDTPKNVKKSSNARWNWNIQIRREGSGFDLGLHEGPVLSRIFNSSKAWLHRDRSKIHVYRYASSANYELLLDNRNVSRGKLEISNPVESNEESKSAVGFARAVDAIEFQIHKDILGIRPELDHEEIARFRPMYFRYLALNSELLNSESSIFGINLLCTSALGMLSATALKNNLGLKDAWGAIPNKVSAAKKVLSSIFGENLTKEDSDDGDEGRQTLDVLELWSKNSIQIEMDRLVKSLWHPIDDDFYHWLRKVFLETLRSSFETAVQVVLPEMPDNDISIEIVESTENLTLVIMESDAGGVGIIDRLLTEISANPGLLDSALSVSLTECKNEKISSTINKAISITKDSKSALYQTFANIRAAQNYHDLNIAKDELISSLEIGGCDVDKETITSLVAKVLSPGSSIKTDRWILGLGKSKKRITDKLGISLDLKVWAYWLLSKDRVSDNLSTTLKMITGEVPSSIQLSQAVQRLTIEICRDSCPYCLGNHGDINGIPASRDLAKRWLKLESLDIIINANNSANWLALLDDALEKRLRIRIRYSNSLKNEVSIALSERLSREYDRGYVLSSFRVAEIRRLSSDWEVHLHIDNVETI